MKKLLIFFLQHLIQQHFPKKEKKRDQKIVIRKTKTRTKTVTIKIKIKFWRELNHDLHRQQIQLLWNS